MRGTIFDIKHFAVHDGPGIRQTIFLKGCPLHCVWCHNPESQLSKSQSYKKFIKIDGCEFVRQETLGYEIDAPQLLSEILGDRIFFEESGGGVTFSGGEPCMQSDFLIEMLTLCRQNGIHTAVDTSGFVNKSVFEQIAKQTDLFLYDLKLVDELEHTKYTGVSVLPILENLYWLDSQKISYIIRIPIVPAITDTPENLFGLLSVLTKLENCQRIELLPFHNISQHKYERFSIQNQLEHMLSMSAEMLNPVIEYFNKNGISVVVNA